MSLIESVPVDPYIDSRRRLVSLAAVGPLDAFTLGDNDPVDLPGGASTRLRSYGVESSIVASAGFGSLVSLNAKAQTRYFLIDFVAWADPVDGPTGSAIAKVYYGVGFRIAIKAWSTETDVRGSAFGVAAQSTLGLASSSYEMRFFGIDLKHLGPVSGFIGNNVGDFNAGSVQQIGGLSAAMASLIFKPTTTRHPVPLAVDLNVEHPLLGYRTSASVCLGLRGLSERIKLADLLAHIPPVPDGLAVDNEEVRRVYRSAGVSSDTLRPTSSQSNLAEDLLFD